MRIKKALSATALLLTTTIALSACSSESIKEKKNTKSLSEYVKSVMDCSYHGTYSDYKKQTGSDADSAEQVHQMCVDYYAEATMYLLDVHSDYVSDDVKNGFKYFAEDVLKKTSYEVGEGKKSGTEGEWEVVVTVNPIDPITYVHDDVAAYIDQFNTTYADVDWENMSDEELAPYEEVYATEVLAIIKNALPNVPYSDSKKFVVTVNESSDGYKVDDEIWNDLDDVVVGLDDLS